MSDLPPGTPTPDTAVFLGCPLWGYAGWVGTFYSDDAKPGEFLSQYSTVFNAVEGNTTFYSLPSAEAVRRWRDAVPDGFRFCFKFPRDITHTRLLAGCDDPTEAFLRRLSPLGNLLGPLILQLPPGFGPDHLGALSTYLQRLPTDLPVAVELRNPGFFASSDTIGRVDRLLAEHGCERVVMDTRALRAGDPTHPAVASARHRKPNLPVIPAALTTRPLVRWVGHPDPGTNEPWLAELAGLVAGWIESGRTPYVMIHCPDTAATPDLARRFAELLATDPRAAGVDGCPLPPFPAERSTIPGAQLSLFEPASR
jgi:uncharacterized protein YecE (DUF72 family)